MIKPHQLPSFKFSNLKFPIFIGLNVYFQIISLRTNPTRSSNLWLRLLNRFSSMLDTSLTVNKHERGRGQILYMMHFRVNQILS
jgi:hypothetical protein